MYPMSILRRMNLNILFDPRAGWIYVYYKNPEQYESMYPIRTRSRMDLYILLEPGAGGIYVSY